MRVRIARTHHRAAIFENHNGIDEAFSAQRTVLLDPDVHNGAKFGDAHLRERQIVPRRKTNDAAKSLFGAGNQQASHILLAGFAGRAQRRIVIFENERASVIRIVFSACARVARTHVTQRIVCRNVVRRRSFGLAFPRPFGASGGNQHPVSGQRIQSAMGLFFEIKGRHDMLRGARTAKSVLQRLKPL